MDTIAREDEALPLKDARKFISVASHLQSTALLLARLGFGFSLFITGRGHLHNAAKMIERFTDWGVPLPKVSVYVSGYTEMIGGLLLMLGLATRLVSLTLVFNFIAAYLTASKDKVHDVLHGPFSSDNWGAILDDAAFPYLMISLVLLAFGPGKVSADYIFERFLFDAGPDESDDPDLGGSYNGNLEQKNPASHNAARQGSKE